MASRNTELTNGRRTFEDVTAPPLPGTERTLCFGPFVLDSASGRLSEGDRPIPLAPKAFEVLLHLARRSGRTVPKNELIEQVWPGAFVADEVLAQSVAEIRRALGDDARTPRYVQTVPRRGYRFLMPVQAGGPSMPEPTPPSPVPPTLGQPKAAPAGVSRRRRGVAAVLVVVLLAAGLLTWRLRFHARPPAAPEAASAVEPGSLLILPVTVDEPTRESAWLREGLAEMIRSQLGQTPGLQVVARHRLTAALDQAGSDPTSSPEAALRLARRLGAERIVTGSFVHAGDRFVVNAQVVEAAGGRTEGTASVRGRMPADLLDAVDELCLKLLHQLTPATMRPDEAGPTGPVRLTTRSVEASRDYMEALTHFARGGRQEAETAEALLDQALAKDDTFAQAYVKKAEIQQWRRRWGYGNPDPAPAVLAAARLMKELPNREKLLVESFEALIIRDQPALALRDWNALLQFYPTYAQEAGVPGLVADTLMLQGRWDDLILVGEAHVDSPSLPDAERARLSTLLAQAFRRKGEFEPALRNAQRAVRLWPTRQGPGYLSQRTVMGRIALDAGRRAQALEEFRAVAGAPEADVPNLVNAAWGFYMADLPEDAKVLVERAIALDPAYGNAYHLRGWMALARADSARAAPDLLNAFELTPQGFGSTNHGLVSGDLAALYYAGVAYLKSGQQERGRRALENLIAHCRRLQQQRSGEPLPAPDWQAANFTARALARLGRPAPEPPPLLGDDTTFFVQSARLHAVQGRREEALRELGQGLALGHGEHRHIQDDPDFESLRPDPEFQRLLGN